MIMKRFFSKQLIGLIGLISFIGSIGEVQARQMPLGTTATASVLTCGPGDDFYTTFGHTAIRICDTARGLDVVYNYGTFDFNTPHFYWKFMRGRLDYCLGRTTFANFMTEYAYEGREVREQRLAMDSLQLNNLYLLLETNYLPEYRNYRYDFFKDNCATRVRDIVYHAWGGDTTMNRTAARRSYRRLVGDNLRGTLEWWRLGIDMLFGLPADHRCVSTERMFLPAELEAEMAECSPKGMDGNQRIVEPSSHLLVESRAPLSRSIKPVWMFLLLLSVALVLTARGGWPRWADRVLFVLAGLVGLFLCFMWFGTDHYCTQWNLNILWASPMLILIAIRLERSPRWALWLQEGCFAVAAVWVLWCGLSIAILPLVVLLAFRVAMLLKQ